MEAEFWHQRWSSNQLGFHESEPNPLLIAHIDQLSLAPGARIFLPLCGKTLDIGWLLDKGFQVAGAELSEIAIQQLFADLELEPAITAMDKLTRYSAPNLDMYVGDIFELTSDRLGLVDAIYDRAALVALPGVMRRDYAAHLIELTNTAAQLLICFEYDQSIMSGPPFSINADEVRLNYEQHYALTCLETIDVVGGLKGKCPATESIWVLAKN